MSIIDKLYGRKTAAEGAKVAKPKFYTRSRIKDLVFFLKPSTLEDMANDFNESSDTADFEDIIELLSVEYESSIGEKMTLKEI